ncbi:MULTISPECIES: glycerol-3-phosphate dehydrogenase/oxidase [Cyanophyceae]|uniref:glycerol-3-phosphate dehydrogenase/oxidase n=1 Tax=Cyanophyceae TaxID=3028117 RepID=UPI001682DBA9|nr:MULTISPECIES: glycerol-3-phosphate dehydrogenase/oxidase [Cyanophyceae]MBD1914875.1 glycerol-3-phosphate dehydrogenase/oxidase [Phormidium sp. FACHB-77]MBD2028553.1 glycerol-3-phosphate dehydrogenase/oxidase [Phormidium sp. FACHB-322]MBD2051803.1 glycerol-3-phosphate dehydrogenase/oxidase [Leptolyngbya sp. FACHB-60]
MRDLQALTSLPFDLIVIGGGINGAATARDAALRGLRTILIEKGDFGGGTTSWSSRLLHGGLRYLEYFEFDLVRESLHEREVLLRNAPHLVKPLSLTIPIYRSGSRSYRIVQAGMVLYDLLSYDKSLPNHRMLSRRSTRQLFRAIDADGLAGAAQYYDGQAEHAERLCLENILDAEQAGATVLNYAQVEDIHLSEQRITGLTCRDLLSGDPFEVTIHDRSVVINASGPWVDEVCGLSQSPVSKGRQIGGTKGSHIIVDAFPGAPNSALYVEAKSDGRPFFILPWLSQYLIGTTDEHYTGSLDRVKADDAEIDYLLKETNAVLPAAHLTREDVRFTYAGVRPLPYAEGKKTGSITRAHILHDHSQEGAKNLISLIGGKLTTHRQVGEEFVNAAFRQRGEAVPTCPTHQRPLPGAMLLDDPRVGEWRDRYRHRIAPTSLSHLIAIYGARTGDLLALIDRHPALAQPIVDYAPDIQAQIVFAVQAELAHTFVDILRHRTTVAMHHTYGFAALPVVAQVLQEYCGWSENLCDRNIRAYHQFMSTNCIPDYALGQESASLQTA